MTTLNERAQAIRNTAASALDDQLRDEVVQRALALAAKLNQTAQRVAQAKDTVQTLVDLKVVAGASSITPSDRRVRSLIAKAEERAATLPELVQSGLPGDLELGTNDYMRSLESSAKEAWKQYASDRAGSIGAESELLEKALGSIPRFRETIEQARYARLKVNVLKARDLPSAEEIREFQAHLQTLDEANQEFEREVPPEFRDTLRRCATRSGVSPGDLPDGFVDWIDEVGAQSYFKVTLSDL